ncbi:hypothetical protein [Lentzea californiensis]|uniref:hypothetical protein n=1 Tax=Lentzea californiensis TaxID=438851 RepID=UPI0021647F96|nr:hypothetical protein [Lentzea californiensis]
MAASTDKNAHGSFRPGFSPSSNTGATEMTASDRSTSPPLNSRSLEAHAAGAELGAVERHPCAVEVG